MRKHGLCTALCLLTFAGPAVAADMGVPDPTLPNGGFFGGLGGSYNAINFGTQNVYAVGTSNTYSGGALVATGTAAGPAKIYMPSQGNFAPEAQLGYFQHFTGSNWLWGAKFNYSYLGTTAATSSVVLPQSGAFTSGGTTTPFTGNALVNSYQTSINDQISMLLFVGRSFDRGFFYLGAGPTLALTQTYLNGVTGRHQRRAHADYRHAHQSFQLGVGLGRRRATRCDLLPRPELVSRRQFRLQHDGEPDGQL